MDEHPDDIQDDEDDDNDQELQLAVAFLVLVLCSAEEAARISNSRRRRLYLRRAELLPNPRAETPWQALWGTRSDRAYITTMGVDVATFDYLLKSGFANAWSHQTIPRTDANPPGQPRVDTSLREIFALVPSTVSRYLKFSRNALLSVLCSILEAAIRFPRENHKGINEFQENNELIVASSVATHPLSPRPNTIAAFSGPSCTDAGGLDDHDDPPFGVAHHNDHTSFTFTSTVSTPRRQRIHTDFTFIEPPADAEKENEPDFVQGSSKGN
ncbi:hypothetical protein BXZ70DRAFT_1005398 [Cristinia sonorae]|uniref:Uncharacterized protein n=1 Tax=Cristinia sonorae TaxID=1940300 RepID=A0A8K0XSM3_9AGAR|nr:hypothetical protein BXZ70DRAFT_1005398 [Cristinia sonorae]